MAVRLGGDEFALILIREPKEAQTVAQKLVDSLSARYQIGSLDLDVSASIGIAGYPESGTTSEALLRRADEAKCRGGKRGREAGLMKGLRSSQIITVNGA